MNSNFYISGNSDQGDIFQGTWKTLLEIMKLKFMFLIKCQAFVHKAPLSMGFFSVFTVAALFYSPTSSVWGSPSFRLPVSLSVLRQRAPEGMMQRVTRICHHSHVLAWWELTPRWPRADSLTAMMPRDAPHCIWSVTVHFTLMRGWRSTLTLL